jgi:hypothetical protein
MTHRSEWNSDYQATRDTDVQLVPFLNARPISISGKVTTFWAWVFVWCCRNEFAKE